MKETEILHQRLLMRVAARLSETSSATDHLMLTKWRVLSMCQYLLGGPEEGIENACREALEAFVEHGPGTACDKPLKAAGSIIRRAENTEDKVLPSISEEKRVAISESLDALAAGGVATIARALGVLQTARERMRVTGQMMCLPGIRHRFELIATMLEDSTRPAEERARAGAAVLYVEEVMDVIPDTLGLIGMIDDDYALRVVLEEIGDGEGDPYIHWSEKLSSLWDDLPFLQGVKLQRGDTPISVSWLDRANSYVSYSHVLGSETAALVLLQPSIACSPLHSIVSLIGLLVLDALTSSQSEAQKLRSGQTYELDGFVVRFEGIAGPPTPGWLRLRMRDGVVYQPPGLAVRMIPIDTRRLSSSREFSSRPRNVSSDPMQRFFDWDATIGPASIGRRLVLVASRQRALDLLEGVQSNGVRLLDHGLVRFVTAFPDNIETHGTLLLVVPSLSTARMLLDRGTHVQAILVDGYERLHRGRHELAFLINRLGAPSIISWSATGYYPAAPPTWLPPHKRLEVSSDDLASILELDDSGTNLSHSSLWEAATGIVVQTQNLRWPSCEVAIVDAIDSYLQALRSSGSVPDHWKYHLMALAKTLRLLVISTPAGWAEIRRFGALWSSCVDEKWSSLRSSAITALASLRDAERRVMGLMESVPAAFNSCATGLVEFLSSTTERRTWYFVCDCPEQVRAAAAIFRKEELRDVEPVLLRDLAICSNCMVGGWVNTSFARRLWAHTPRAIITFTDEADSRRWERAAEVQQRAEGQSLLDAVGGFRSAPCPNDMSSSESDEVYQIHDGAELEWRSEYVPCVFLWVTGETRAKVLEPGGRVVVEEGDVVSERLAVRLRPDDRVILGLGANRWSPADEFTGALLSAVEASHPELVKTAKEWRRALRQRLEERQLSTRQLLADLVAVGVDRKTQTLDGWLDIGRASPISPRGQHTEIAALWPLVEQYARYSLDEVADGCARLRALRTAAGHALLLLWKGRTVELGVDAKWLGEVVDRLRQEVQVYEIEGVTLGDVPTEMLGWWIPPALAARFESESGHRPSTVDDQGDE